MIYSYRSRRIAPFLYALIFKSALDAMIPWINRSIDLSTISGIYLSEVMGAAFGLAAFLGIKYLF